MRALPFRLEVFRSFSFMCSSSGALAVRYPSPCVETLKGLYLVSVNFWDHPMRYASQIKPISYLKANAAEVLLQLAKKREPLVITQNGEAKAVIQDIATYEETQETLALLKLLALGNREIEEGKVKPVADVVSRIRTKKATP